MKTLLHPVALSAWLLLCGMPAVAAEGAPDAPRSLGQSALQALGLPSDMPVEYQDKDGKPIAIEAFVRASRASGNVVTVDRSQAGKLVLRLKKGKATSPVAGLTHLPALEARDLAGRPVRNLDLAGKHTLLSFYYSDCAPCVQEVPALNAYRKAHPELNYLAITFDPAFDARQFVSERKLSWPVVADAGGFLKAAGVRSFPAYMLVAPDGRILGRGAGLAMHGHEETPGLAALEKFVDGQLKDAQ